MKEIGNSYFRSFKISIGMTSVFWVTTILLILSFRQGNLSDYLSLEMIPLFIASLLICSFCFHYLKEIGTKKNAKHLLFASVILGVGFVLVEALYLAFGLALLEDIQPITLLIGLIYTISCIFLTLRIKQQLRIDQNSMKKKTGQHYLMILGFIVGHAIFGGIFTVTEAFQVSSNPDYFVVEFISLLLLISISIIYGELQYNEKQLELSSKNEDLNFLAYHDMLTQLPNRLFLKDKIKELIAKKEPFYLFFLDLDHFKSVNDYYGHHLGDELLKTVSKRIVSTLTEEDYAARLGGDEFTIILRSAKGKEALEIYAESLIQSISTPIALEGNEIHVTTSLGISRFPNDGVSVYDLMKKADIAMYHAKAEGRNTYCLHNKELEEGLMKELKLKEDLSLALDKDEFEVYYQPIIGLKDKRVIGFEALIRWNHYEKGLLPPSDFIYLAEETGTIIPIGEWVLRTACQRVQAWNEHYQESYKISVNLSLKQFSKKNLVLTIMEILKETGLAPSLLELEITESTAMLDTEYTLRTIRKIKELGIQISIDDFGTGYSSLSHLKQFEVQTIKIDKSFIGDILETGSERGIASAILTLAQNLGLRVVAEGVEESEQVHYLLNQGCENAQGFLFSRPLSSEMMESYIVKERSTKLSKAVTLS